MSLPFRRRSRPRGAARLALTGDFNEDGYTVTEMLEAAGPSEWDGTTTATITTGAYVLGLPEGVTAFAVKQHGRDTEPLARYQPAPASFPALQAAPEPRDILAAVPVTEPAVIGDELRLPVIWCEMPRCVSWFRDPAADGFADVRDRADANGWRTDALSRFACPECQQGRADYRTPQPVTWQHTAVPRHWNWNDEYGRPNAEVQDRWASGQYIGEPLPEGHLEALTGAAEYARSISYQNPELTRAIMGATHRTAAS